jgi:transcriptional regulator with XRE-family HTH domain
MSTPTDTSKTIHQGRNVKRFREMMGLKQEALADRLGADWTQKKISYVETREVIEQDLLEQLAEALKVPAEAIVNFDEEKAVYNIQNNYDNTSSPSLNYQPTFNPFDKYDQLVEENKKLYELLLKAEREKNALLERLLSERNSD